MIPGCLLCFEMLILFRNIDSTDPDCFLLSGNTLNSLRSISATQTSEKRRGKISGPFVSKAMEYKGHYICIFYAAREVRRGRFWDLPLLKGKGNKKEVIYSYAARSPIRRMHPLIDFVSAPAVAGTLCSAASGSHAVVQSCCLLATFLRCALAEFTNVGRCEFFKGI